MCPGIHPAKYTRCPGTHPEKYARCPGIHPVEYTRCPGIYPVKYTRCPGMNWQMTGGVKDKSSVWSLRQDILFLILDLVFKFTEFVFMLTV